MKFAPRPYQKKIIDFIIRNKRCAVFAGMGMGKTVSTLTAAYELIRVQPKLKVLIIAPLRVAKATWPHEIHKWDHLKHLSVGVVCGTSDQREKALREDHNIYVTNFECIEWLVNKYGENWPFRMVVVDESTRLKGFKTRGGSLRAKALAKVAHTCVARFVELTGTPAPNGLLDLWGQMWFIDRGERLGVSLTRYKQNYFVPRKVGHNAFAVAWDAVPGSDKRIKNRIADVTLTVNAEDYFPIEEPIHSDVVVELPPAAARVYKDLKKDFLAMLESGDEIEAPSAAAKLQKLLQVASGAVYTNDGPARWEEVHKAKIDGLQSVIEEANGAPVLVAYNFKHEAARILEAFKGAELLDKNPETIARWNAGKIPILLAHPASCGHGLNLQDGGNILCFFGLTYNYEHHAQILERIGPTRQMQAGHPRPVYVYYIMAKGSADYGVREALRRKESVLNYLLEKSKWQDPITSQGE